MKKSLKTIIAGTIIAIAGMYIIHINIKVGIFFSIMGLVINFYACHLVVSDK